MRAAPDVFLCCLCGLFLASVSLHTDEKWELKTAFLVCFPASLFPIQLLVKPVKQLHCCVLVPVRCLSVSSVFVCVMLDLLFGGIQFVCECVCVFRLLGNFWPPAQQTEIKLRFSSVRGQLVSLWTFNVGIIDFSVVVVVSLKIFNIKTSLSH